MTFLPAMMKELMLKILEVRKNIIEIETSAYHLIDFHLKHLISFNSNFLDTNISMPVGESEIDAADPGIVDSSSIIIIHPGSRYLRIGRASDTTPKRILHAVARKRRKAAIKVSFMPGIILRFFRHITIFISFMISHTDYRMSLCNDGITLLSPK